MNHTPVLLGSVLKLLDPKPGDSALDVTLGLGGHSLEILKKIGSNGSLIGLDADAENLEEARKRLSAFPNALLLHANFGALPDCLPEDRRSFDLILADLGLSSPHIDTPERGFTFRTDSPLDMRFDRSSGFTAAHILQSTDRMTLTKIFSEYGELPKSLRLAQAVEKSRSVQPIAMSSDLQKIAETVYGYKAKGVMAQIFQALRIAVNRELRVLKDFLSVAPTLLKNNGRLAIISYHSLEDRLVKTAFKALTTPTIDEITGAVKHEAPFDLLTRKPILPSESEIKTNPRARSAVLRGIRKSA